MATPTVLSGVSSQPSFEPIDNVLVNTPQSIQKYAGNVNFLYLITDAYMQIEEANTTRLNSHNEKLENTMDRIETITALLKNIRTGLSNTYAKDVELDPAIVEKMKKYFPNEALFGKEGQLVTTMSRELATTVFKDFTDKNNLLNSDFRKLSTQANHYLEDATKILSLVEKLVENYRQLIERIQSKSRG
ncbi:MAG TPA: hypothetical protein VIJ14_04805 [Rhabdochlamydiaceae bacterium]